MTLCIRTDGAWTALPYGLSATNAKGIQASYDTLLLWSEKAPESLTDFGVFEVPEPDPPPAGKVEASRALVGEDRPAWKVEYRDAPAPAVPVSVFDYQFAGEAEARKFITREECDAWVGPGVVPNSLLNAVAQIIPDEEARRPIVLFLKGSKEFPRYHENTLALAPLFGLDTSASIDAFFIAASLR